MHVIAPCQAGGLVLPEITDPVASDIETGTVFLARRTAVPSTPVQTLMAFMGGFPAIYGQVTEPVYDYLLQIKTSDGLKTIQGLQ